MIKLLRFVFVTVMGLFLFSGYVYIRRPVSSFLAYRTAVRARALVEKGDEEEAIELYRKITEKYPQPAEPLFEALFATAIFDTTSGRYEEAAESCDRIISTAYELRKKMRAFEIRAMARAGAGDFARAAADLEELLQQAVNIDIEIRMPSPVLRGPFDPARRFELVKKFRLRLVGLYWRAGETESAIAHLEALLAECSANPRELKLVIVTLEQSFDNLFSPRDGGVQSHENYEEVRVQLLTAAVRARKHFEEMITGLGERYAAARGWAEDGRAVSGALEKRLTGMTQPENEAVSRPDD